MKILELKDLAKSYGKKAALDGVSLSLNPGQVCGLLGNNGAGKSTLMKIVCGLIPAYSGKVKIMGRDAALLRKESGAVIGGMIEAPAFFSELTGFQNLMYISKYYGGPDKKGINKILEKAGLKEQANTSVEKYSLGMLQRLHFARAVMNGPKLLILDEPFNGIDPSARKILKDMVAGMAAEGCAALISSHFLPDIQSICGSVCILNRGKAVYSSDDLSGVDLEEVFLSAAEGGGQAQ